MAIATIGGGAFFAGMQYGQSRVPAFGPGMTQNLTAEQRQQMFQGRTGGDSRFRMGTGADGSVASGEILSKDADSITVTLRDPRGVEGEEIGSRIILYSDATRIMKLSEGAAEDVEAGKNVAITGTANAGGSITAESIQVRPPVSTPSPSA